VRVDFNKLACPLYSYFTFDDISTSSANDIKDVLQLPYTPPNYATFDTLQIINDINVPATNWNRGTVPEPITSYFGPNNPTGDNYGRGGATQVITNTPITDFQLSDIEK
jgi:hypothetical protein